MTAHKIGRVAVRGTASYEAAAYICMNGPQTPEALFTIANFGHKTSHKQDKLDRALASGWLVQNADGKIDCGTTARAHFAGDAGETKAEPIGQIAAVREPVSVFTRPPLSRKNIPNPRGTRQDIPAWSVRSGPSFYKA